MVLSEDEQRRLHRIERGIWATDPVWARTVSSPSSGIRRRRKRMALLLSTDTAALALISLGALGTAFLVIFLGFMVASLAACLHVSRY
jgi:hypothetical protein